MKKIILVISLFLLFAGVATASSLNGDYKGNPIVIVKSDGKQLETDEVPAMIYDGHTVVPISLLRQIGASVIWDQSTYSVDVKLPSSSPATDVGVIKVLNLKKYAELADLYKLTQDLSDRMSSYSDFLSLYFNGHNTNYSSAYTDQEVTTRINELVSNYNKISDNYNAAKSKFTISETNDLFNAIKMDYDSLDNFKMASDKIRDWNYYRNIYDSVNSQSAFNAYLKASTDGFNLSQSALKTSRDGYDTYILKVINE